MLLVGVLGASALAGDPSPPMPTPKVLEAGKAAYDQTCVACHGATGEGNGPVAFAIKPPPRNFRKDPFKAGDSVLQVFHTITYGLPDTKMVGYPQLDETARWGLAYIVVSLRPKK
ncbi:MAG: c-type cytochrome [Acidobacteriota bacterium]